MIASYRFNLDSFRYTKPNGVNVFDPFEDGIPPPDISQVEPPPPGLGVVLEPYFTLGTFEEENGRAIMDSVGSEVSSDLSAQAHLMLFQADTNNAEPIIGLKRSQSWTVEALFDLTVPTENNQEYGILISDFAFGHETNDEVTLSVQRGADGVLRIRLTEQATGQTDLHEVDFFSADQILLRLSHSVASDFVTGSFQYFFNGTAGAQGTFDLNPVIYNGELWTRPGVYSLADNNVPISDDFADSLSDAGAPVGQLEINSSLNGQIEIGDDRDFFKVFLEKGMSYQFDLLGQDSGRGSTLDDPYLWLHDSKGRVILQNDDISDLTFDAQITYTAKKTGVFYLQAAGFLEEETGAYRIQATAIAPEVEVSGNGIVIADGDGTPSAADGTDFGLVGLGSTTVHTFTVANTGTAVLTTSKLKVPKGFIILEGLSASIDPGESDTFQIGVDSRKAGFKSGSIKFSTNDSDKAAFDFGVSATVSSSVASLLAALYEEPVSSLPTEVLIRTQQDDSPVATIGVSDYDFWSTG